MGLGKRIKEILNERKMTIKDLASLSGVSLNTLYSITKRDNNMARFDIVEKIADALCMSPSELTQQDIDYSKVHEIKNARLHEVVQKGTVYTPPANYISLFSGEPPIDEGLCAHQDEQYILYYYKLLNPAGQERALDQIELLTKIPEYQASPSDQPQDQAGEADQEKNRF